MQFTEAGFTGAEGVMRKKKKERKTKADVAQMFTFKPGTCSDGQLQLGEVPLVHVVVSHQLVTAGEFLLTVWPPAVKRLLT